MAGLDVGDKAGMGDRIENRKSPAGSSDALRTDECACGQDYELV